MPTVTHSHRFSASLDDVWDASLSVALHQRSLASSRESVLQRPDHDVLRLGDRVTWRARYLGLWWRMQVRIAAVDHHVSFVDEQVRGPFATFRHEHRFCVVDGAVIVSDAITFRAPLRPFGVVAEPVVARVLRGVLRDRAAGIEAHVSGRA